MNQIKLIAFTHKTTDISKVGKVFIEESERKECLGRLKNIGIQEVFYLATCNRIEFLLVDDFEMNTIRKKTIFSTLFPNLPDEEYDWMTDNSAQFQGASAAQHLFETASSLDSLVIGEREIITQVKQAYSECLQHGLSGEITRILITKAIECAKKIYTHTNIARNPVSIVSLAFRMLKRLPISKDARILVIGSGETNTKMCKFLHKFGFKNFVVFNRTLKRGQTLAKSLNTQAYPLASLPQHQEGFDILLTCTSSEHAIITPEIYSKLLHGETSKKIIVDLALPNDVNREVINTNVLHYIEVESLKQIAEKNLQERSKELVKCNEYIQKYLSAFQTSFKERMVELAMREVPLRMKEIKEKAFAEVFAKDLEGLDERSKEVLEKMLSYMEKKYISVPMKLAKEIMSK